MSLDTKYRPTRYSDVVGQESTIAVLKQYVMSGKGRHQSYVFCGGHGQGKTTLARILVRAILCDAPVEGEPCDECPSCTSLIRTGTSESFTEIDAATNSGKADIKQVTTELQYATYSGKPRIYLWDESHELSRQAMDAMLKPMEDTILGSSDKQLVNVFCTTEPEKMRKTIFSRCAPAFVIRSAPPETIAVRLAYVCEQEDIEYDQEALVLIAEVSESHIRDALKAVEGVSQLGKVDIDNVRSYLHLGSAEVVLDLLGALGSSLDTVVSAADSLNRSISPGMAYEKIADTAMMAYRLSLGVGNAPSYWDKDKLSAIASDLGDFLIVIAEHLSSKPAKPRAPMLLCDLVYLHHTCAGTMPALNTITSVPVSSAESGLPNREVSDLSVSKDVTKKPSPPKDDMPSPESSGKVSTDPRNFDPGSVAGEGRESWDIDRLEAFKPLSGDGVPPLEVDFFRALLCRRVAELRTERESGQKGRTNMGGNRA